MTSLSQVFAAPAPYRVSRVEICADERLAPSGFACILTIDPPVGPITDIALLRSQRFEGGLDSALTVDLLMLAVDAQANTPSAWTMKHDPLAADGTMGVTLQATSHLATLTTVIGIHLTFNPAAPLSIVNDPRPILGELLRILNFKTTDYTITEC